jgi:hypothetical protein
MQIFSENFFMFLSVIRNKIEPNKETSLYPLQNVDITYASIYTVYVQYFNIVIRLYRYKNEQMTKILFNSLNSKEVS